MLLLIVCLAIAAGIYFYLSSAASNSQSSLGDRLRDGLVNRKNQWKCSPLRQELRKRLDADTTHRLIMSAKLRYPGKPEHWYLEKVLYDLKRGR